MASLHRDPAFLDRFLVRAGQPLQLRRDFDPGFHFDLEKEEARARLRDSIQELALMQDMLYAQNCYGLLIVFQAMDAAGKDGTIKHVMSGLNPQGCRVHAFKQPSAEELDHDYLWRSFKALPERGTIGIFNRSYYEEVLVVRVHPHILRKQQLPPGSIDGQIFERRFEEINHFEKYLVNNGIHVLKIFLYVSKEEQRQRFLDRIHHKEKNWKFSATDVLERAHWEEYMDAYEDCLRHTSTDWAPWYVVPADHKPTTRLIVAGLIGRKLGNMALQYPDLSDEQRERLQAAWVQLESEGGDLAGREAEPEEGSGPVELESDDDLPSRAGWNAELEGVTAPLSGAVLAELEGRGTGSESF